MWALGVVFYRMLEGAYPFKVRRDSRFDWAVADGELRFSANVFAKHVKMIRSMLETDPERRLSVQALLGKYKRWIK